MGRMRRSLFGGYAIHLDGLQRIWLLDPDLGVVWFCSRLPKTEKETMLLSAHIRNFVLRDSIKRTARGGKF